MTDSTYGSSSHNISQNISQGQGSKEQLRLSCETKILVVDTAYDNSSLLSLNDAHDLVMK